MTLRHRHRNAIAVLALVSAFLSGCATNANYPWERWEAQKALEEAAAANTAPVPPSRLEEDRRAILAMAGDFNVTFTFRETVPLVAGYTLKKPSATSGVETVRVVEDKAGTISLEHTLVSGGKMVERWRENWTYEPRDIISYLGPDKWEQRSLNTVERRGRWARLVDYGNGGPRNAALGAWTHENAISSWTSAAAWQPMPRRESGRTDDYDVLLAVDRLTLTPSGWVHEQDNTKLLLPGGPKALAREAGLGTYVRAARGDKSAAAQ
jgi:hypothetical protein